MNSISEEIVDGETYVVTTYDTGHIVRELTRPDILRPRRKTMSLLEFKRQFSLDELVAFKTLAKTDDMADVFYDLCNSTQEMNMADPLTIQGVGYLVSAGIISQEKANSILGGI